MSDIEPKMDPGAIDPSGPGGAVYRVSWLLEAAGGGGEAVKLRVSQGGPGGAEQQDKTLDFEASDAGCEEDDPAALVPPEVARLTCSKQVYAVGHEGDALLLYAAPVGQPFGEAFMRVGLSYGARVLVGTPTE